VRNCPSRGPATVQHRRDVVSALTGRLPFAGKFFEVMMNKQNFDPPAPVELVNNVPPDLTIFACSCCDASPKSAQRARVLRILGTVRLVHCNCQSCPHRPQHMRRPPAFVGRERQLRQLNEAFAFTRREQTGNRLFARSSGMGKTRSPVIFSMSCARPNLSRCSRRAVMSVSRALQALDGVVDSLTKYCCRCGSKSRGPDATRSAGAGKTLSGDAAS